MFHEVSTYAPDEVFLTFGGAVVEGWDSITVQRTSPEFKTVKGIDGKNTRVYDPNTHAVINIVCKQTSLTNQILSSVVLLDSNTHGVRLEVMLLDSSGWEVFSSQEAYVQRTPDRDYKASMGTRSWTIECLNSSWNDSKGNLSADNIFTRVMDLF